MISSKLSFTHSLLKILVLIGVVVLPVEILSFTVGKLLVRKALLYDPPRVESYTNYLKSRDPVLGWPSRANFGKGEFDRSGSRIVPNFPDPSLPSCVTLFGDSFTWGDEVAPEYTYGNVLSGLMGCRVANYGVYGYGTDQAYLRFKDVINDNAPIVILGHFSDNITRNVNQERGFMTNQAFHLKPRFILEGNELKLVPLPNMTEDEYWSLGSRAKELLPYDYFAPGGPAGIHSFKFPFSISVLGTFQHYRLQVKNKRQPYHAQFYDPEHPSHALQVTEAIIKAFVSEAKKRNQKPLVLLIPNEQDLLWLRDHGVLPYAELANRLRKAGIIVLDAGEELNKSLGNRDPCEFFMRCGVGHLNPEGYKRLAEIVFAKLREIRGAQTQ